MRDAALDCGGFCADLLTEDLDFVGIADKLLLSKAGCKLCNGQPQVTTTNRTSSRLAISSHCRNQNPARWGPIRADPELETPQGVTRLAVTGAEVC